ncbi:MAG: hypothetical protein RJA07_2247 [Bacteroidota bacterium]|jgi:hypothetical protein
MKKTLLLLVIASLFLVKTNAQNCTQTTASNTLDINNVNATLMNGGDMWWDRGLMQARYEVPKGGGVSTEFAGAIWIGGIDQTGSLHVAAQTYRQSGNDFFAGPLDSTGQVSANTCTDYDKIWKINNVDIQTHINNTNRTLANTPASILEWPAIGNPYAKGNGGVSLIIKREMAPYVDVDGISGYNPLGGDYPKICGDQALWWVFNDNGNIHTETNGAPMQIEIQTMAYAFTGSGQENNTTFYSYKITNKGNFVFDSTFFSIWNDADLGCANDDYIGCDTARNMMISYNADANDQPCPTGYGTNIPMMGIGLIQAPLNQKGLPTKMSSCTYFNNSNPIALSGPTNASQYYGYMTGTWRDGTHFTQGGNAHGGTTNTNYVYTDAPNLNGTNSITGQPYWSMCNPTPITPGDLRTVMSFGPLKFVPGQSQTITIAATTVFNITYPCPSFQPIQQAMDYVKTFFQTNSCNTVLENPAATSSVENEKTDLIIYPNPASSKLTISSSKFQTFGNMNTIEISNVLGQLQPIVIEKIHINNCQLNTENLPSGIYFIKITDVNGNITKGKFVKE